MIKIFSTDELMKAAVLLAKAAESVKKPGIPDDTYFAVTDAIAFIGSRLGISDAIDL